MSRADNDRFIEASLKCNDALVEIHKKIKTMKERAEDDPTYLDQEVVKSALAACLKDAEKINTDMEALIDDMEAMIDEVEHGE